MTVLSITPEPGTDSYDFEIANGKVRVEQYTNENGDLRNRAVLTGNFASLDDSALFWSVLPDQAIAAYHFGSYTGRGFNDGNENAIKYIIKGIPIQIASVE